MGDEDAGFEVVVVEVEVLFGADGVGTNVVVLGGGVVVVGAVVVVPIAIPVKVNGVPYVAQDLL